MDDMQQLQEKNQMIRQLVHDWDHPTLQLLVLDIGPWMDLVTEWNARHMGMITTSTMDDMADPMSNDLKKKNFTLQRLGCGKYPPSVAMVCATLPKKNNHNDDHCSHTCIRNQLSIDGMHWCMESIGGRVTAATACLIECSLLFPKHKLQQQLVRQCEHRCNDDFMSMKPAADIIKTYNSINKATTN
jgi:hypothetical protein